MAKTTQVCFGNPNIRRGNASYILRTTNGEEVYSFCIEGYKDGIVTINPAGTCNIRGLAETLSGCFNADSNFGIEVLKTCKDAENGEFKGIQVEFNGVTLIVTEKNADENEIYREWYAEMQAKEEEYGRSRNLLLKTGEGQMYFANQKAEEKRKNEIKDKIRYIDDTIELEFNSEEGKKVWEKFAETNSEDLYRNVIVDYASRWAKCMQNLVETEGKTIPEVAQRASYICDIEGVTGIMYAYAVSALAQSWKYGEELKRWSCGCTGNDNAIPKVLMVNAG